MWKLCLGDGPWAPIAPPLSSSPQPLGKMRKQRLWVFHCGIPCIRGANKESANKRQQKFWVFWLPEAKLAGFTKHTHNRVLRKLSLFLRMLCDHVKHSLFEHSTWQQLSNGGRQCFKPRFSLWMKPSHCGNYPFWVYMRKRGLRQILSSKLLPFRNRACEWEGRPPDNESSTLAPGLLGSHSWKQPVGEFPSIQNFVSVLWVCSSVRWLFARELSCWVGLLFSQQLRKGESCCFVSSYSLPPSSHPSQTILFPTGPLC